MTIGCLGVERREERFFVLSHFSPFSPSSVITRYYSNRGVSFSFRRVPSIWRSQSGYITY